MSPRPLCIWCGSPTVATGGLCDQCRIELDAAAARREQLQRWAPKPVELDPRGMVSPAGSLASADATGWP